MQVMDHNMNVVNHPTTKDGTDMSNSVEWQIDSEWIDLSAASSPSVFPANSKKGKQNKHKSSSFETKSLSAFTFVSTITGCRLLIVDNQAFRLNKKDASGYSYWKCSIPCCTAWCVLDSQEKKIVQSLRNHKHDVDINRREFRQFICALKNAIKENPQVKLRSIYDAELEKAKQQWRENNGKSSSKKDKSHLPSFEDVHLAMVNSRNALLSLASLRTTGNEALSSDVSPTNNGNLSRFTRSKDSKSSAKQKTEHAVQLFTGSSDLTDLEKERHDGAPKEASLSDYEEWLDDDINANIQTLVVTPSKQQPRTGYKRTPVKQVQDSKLGLSENEENNLLEDVTLEGVPRRKYRKRPASSSIFTCPHCPYKSNRHFNVQRHERLAHSTKKPEFSCKECGTSYSLEYRLKLHIKAVHQGEGHHCHVCARTFETMTGLKSHIVTKHKHDDPKVHREPPPELTCTLCGRVFSTKSHLQKHTSTHVMIQPYRCCICNKAFMEEVTWLSHQNSCSDAFTLQCCLCSAFVLTAQELMSHMDVVHGRAEYSCHCGKIFPWKKSLLTHQQKCSLFLAERSM